MNLQINGIKQMKWIEVIELRSAKGNQELLESKLQQLIDAVSKEGKQQTIKAYKRVMLDDDFSIHLFHDSNKIENSGSRLGLYIASVLKDFGLVNHSVWAELAGQ